MQEQLDAYRRGDMADRVALFLGYKNLRDQFMAIEQESDPSIPESTWCDFFSEYSVKKLWQDLKCLFWLLS
ncbi:hypothetical protein OAN24_02940 [Pseudodesulfovibrio sp.]|nr:hypothetical protein [Pseudodesulfovibrio sp.]